MDIGVFLGTEDAGIVACGIVGGCSCGAAGCWCGCGGGGVGAAAGMGVCGIAGGCCSVITAPASDCVVAFVVAVVRHACMIAEGSTPTFVITAPDSVCGICCGCGGVIGRTLDDVGAGKRSKTTLASSLKRRKRSP